MPSVTVPGGPSALCRDSPARVIRRCLPRTLVWAPGRGAMARTKSTISPAAADQSMRVCALVISGAWVAWVSS